MKLRIFSVEKKKWYKHETCIRLGMWRIKENLGNERG